MTAPRGLTASTVALFASPKTSAAKVSPPTFAADRSPSAGRDLETQPAEGATPLVDIELIVYGTPGPQGSKNFKGMRTSKTTGKSHAVLVESSAKVKPWRALVAKAAANAGLVPLAGALEVQMVFTLKPPQRMPKGRIYPTCYPDTSKLIRSTEDALTGHAWLDDAQVVRYIDTAKYYPGQHPDALDEPGAVIRIWTIGGAT